MKTKASKEYRENKTIERIPSTAKQAMSSPSSTTSPSSMPTTRNATRFSFGAHMAMLMAASIDDREVATFSQNVSDCMEILIGGRNTVWYLSEIQFVTSILYYLLSLSGDHSTVGDAFSGLQLVEGKGGTESLSPSQWLTQLMEMIKKMTASSGNMSSIYSSSSSSSSRSSPIYSSLQLATTSQLAVLLALIPYLKV